MTTTTKTRDDDVEDTYDEVRWRRADHEQRPKMTYGNDDFDENGEDERQIQIDVSTTSSGDHDVSHKS